MLEKYKYWVWLSSIPGVGSVRYGKLLEHFGNPQGVWEATLNELKGLAFLNRSLIDLILNNKYRDELDIHLERIYKNNIKILTINDELYPCHLKSIYDPPPVLYVKGIIRKEDDNIAIVGSRRATSYGMSMAERLSRELAGLGITVVSGMARGIDSYAHSGALKAGGRTIAVLGCGPDIVYPSENEKLMEGIAKTGLIVSEYIPGSPPVSRNFPARNRIISGMSMGVVVIEAGERSGSLITADFALEQGREVFSVPGNADNFNSRGTNRLIKDGAKMVTDIEDILEELKVLKRANNIRSHEYNSTTKDRLIAALDEDERRIAECLINEMLHIDALTVKTGLCTQIVNSLLVIMELKGVVEQMPGKIFKLKD